MLLQSSNIFSTLRTLLGIYNFGQRLRGARKKCNLYLEVDRYYIFTCQVREMNLRQVQKLAATKTFSDMNGQHNEAKPLLKGAQSQWNEAQFVLEIWAKVKNFLRSSILLTETIAEFSQFLKPIWLFQTKQKILINQ